MASKKSLCKRVKKNQTKCRKLKGCKTAKGPKRTFCRKKKNNTRKNKIVNNIIFIRLYYLYLKSNNFRCFSI